MHHGSRPTEIRHYKYLPILYSLEHKMINILVLGSFFPYYCRWSNCVRDIV